MEMMGYLMETTYNLPREFFVLQINGRITSTHRRYEDALRAGLLLKHQFPHGDIKVCEIVCEINSNEKRNEGNWAAPIGAAQPSQRN